MAATGIQENVIQAATPRPTIPGEAELVCGAIRFRIQVSEKVERPLFKKGDLCAGLMSVKVTTDKD